MANQKEIEERQIPVFTVWKNNAILKNIFVINAPPSLNEIQTHQGHQEGQIGKTTHQEFEETLVVGRHPDCDIRLEHPSISRFHLRIHSNPFTKYLSLTDLSSVHGTWVSGKRIEPNISTSLNEGDALRIGGSSRVYKLNWIPLSQAYDKANPFVPPLDFPESQEDDEEEEETIKDENPLGLENEHNESVAEKLVLEQPPLQQENTVALKNEDNESVAEKVVLEQPPLQQEKTVALKNEDLGFIDPISEQPPLQQENTVALKNEDLGLKNEDHESVAEKVVLEQPPLQQENTVALKNEDLELIDPISESLESLFIGENSEVFVQKGIPLSPPMQTENTEGYENEDLLAEDSILEGLVPLFMGENWAWVGQEDNHLAALNTNEHHPLPCNQGSKDKESSLKEEDIQNDAWNFWYESLNNKVNQYPQHELEPRLLSERKCLENPHLYQNSPSKEEEKERELWSFWSGNMGVESVYSSSSEAEVFSESENKPPSSVKKQFKSPLINSEQKSIWSRRGKQAITPEILTNRSEAKKITNDKENVKHEPISRVLFHEADDEEEEEDEIFTPDKENLTPNTHKSMRKLAVLKQVKHSNSGKSSKFKLREMAVSPNNYYKDGMSPASCKENYSQKSPECASVNRVESVGLRERKGTRLPFQTLLANSPQKSISETAVRDERAMIKDKGSGERIRKWNMVVDITTLLNKESRKALQLLEGLKGTQLIIPRIVIRELDSLKRQVSFFRRNTEVSKALEWIQDCMVKTQWWIHVQSSMEEGRPVAPTPPASPYSSQSIPFSGFESRSELLSPTAEDHVLDYALCFRRNKNDGQLVLLTDDVSLKIQAMAEGMICETAEEFQESLVNPFSERFMWADSSPRGQTWSCLDDTVLREKFYPTSTLNLPKSMQNVKGLKLILLHNSQYYEQWITGIH